MACPVQKKKTTGSGAVKSNADFQRNFTIGIPMRSAEGSDRAALARALAIEPRIVICATKPHQRAGRNGTAADSGTFAGV